ncbi:sensor histidine kinase [Jatrophihabitans sp. YIM 134969]
MVTSPAPPTATPERGAAVASRAERLLRYDGPVRQLAITVAVAAVSYSVLRTVDRPGLQPWAFVLVTLNVLVVAMRLLSDRTRDRVPEVPVAVVGALLAGAVLVLDRSGSTSIFGFFLAGNVGFRRPYTQALLLASWVSVCCLTGVLVGRAAGLVDTPWYLGALTGLSVLLGIANRSRGLAISSAQAAAASALQAAQAEAQVATMSERARIARDVHDVLAHSLAGVNLQLEVVDALLENGDHEAARAAATEAQRQVRESMAEVSRTVHALREDALPLVDTLTALVESGAPPGTRLAVEGEERVVGTRPATALARVAQEALTNARKHAPDAAVRVTLTFADRTVALDIVNGPSAAGPVADTGSGMGLVGMRERVASVGGSVRTGPVTDGDDAGGWHVHAEVPA